MGFSPPRLTQTCLVLWGRAEEQDKGMCLEEVKHLDTGFYY